MKDNSEAAAFLDKAAPGDGRTPAASSPLVAVAGFTYASEEYGQDFRGEFPLPEITERPTEVDLARNSHGIEARHADEQRISRPLERVSLRAQVAALSANNRQESRVYAVLTGMAAIAVVYGMTSSVQLVENWQSFVELVRQCVG